LQQVIGQLREGDLDGGQTAAATECVLVHYQLWGKPGPALNFGSITDSFSRAVQNPSVLSDWQEVLSWAVEETQAGATPIDLPFASPLELHACYTNVEIQAALGGATFESPGQIGVGVIRYAEIHAYALLVTYQKTEHDFSPSTMYADYPVSRTLLHWESQSNTTLESPTGQDLINHEARGYTILIFARNVKRRGGLTVPYTFLGTGRRLDYSGERPIGITWELTQPMPAEMFEENRRGG